jgi:hypothetical protein
MPPQLLILSTELPASYATAIDETCRYYNDINLRLHFTRITSGTTGLPVQYSASLGAGVREQSGSVLTKLLALKTTTGNKKPPPALQTGGFSRVDG